MTVTPKFLDSTRGEVLRRLLSAGPLTARQLAERLGISPNGVRLHLTNLERDGYIEVRDMRETGGKPAAAYGLTAAGENLFPRGYAAVLAAMTDEVIANTSDRRPGDLDPFLRNVGMRLGSDAAAALGEHASASERLAAAVAALEALGAVAEVREDRGVYVVRGRSCPLADIVEGRRDLCRMVAVMLEEILLLPVRETCRRDGTRPCCGFMIGEPI